MYEIEFAFFNLMPNDKRGLVYQKYILNRLAPFLFAPRVACLIDLPVIKARGYHVLLPLGEGNLDSMDPERQQQMLGKSIAVTRGFNLPALAVDRRLKPRFAVPQEDMKLVFGDHFIKALAAAYIKRTLSCHAVKRIIIATDHEDVAEFAEYAARFDVPLSIQSFHPAGYEALAYQMMYEHGRAVSTSLFNPRSWSKGDLVVIFDTQDRLVTISSRDVFALKLSNLSHNLSPLLENHLQNHGLEARLHNLAPIMELCLWMLAARANPRADASKAEDGLPVFLQLEKSATLLGLWELFLDKAI
ncbi:MAG: hypothetical protein GXZ09_10820 [Syntrophomonadaceae bacterium]|jgi:hypothetical protein|nr:hypothetical protein [Syntrophomonadaceae bacterium]